MNLDLGRPHRIVGHHVIFMDNMEVFRSGKLVGVLPKGSAPTSVAEIDALLSPKKEEKKKESKPKESFKGIAASNLYKEKKSVPLTKVVGKKKKKAKKKKEK